MSHHQTQVAWSQHSQPTTLQPQFPHPKMGTAPFTSGGENTVQKDKGEACGTRLALNACSPLSLSQDQACHGSPKATGSKAFGIQEPHSQKSVISAWYTQGAQ